MNAHTCTADERALIDALVSGKTIEEARYRVQRERAGGDAYIAEGRAIYRAMRSADAAWQKYLDAAHKSGFTSGRDSGLSRLYDEIAKAEDA